VDGAGVGKKRADLGRHFDGEVVRGRLRAQRLLRQRLDGGEEARVALGRGAIEERGVEGEPVVVAAEVELARAEEAMQRAEIARARVHEPDAPRDAAAA